MTDLIEAVALSVIWTEPLPRRKRSPAPDQLLPCQSAGAPPDVRPDALSMPADPLGIELAARGVPLGEIARRKSALFNRARVLLERARASGIEALARGGEHYPVQLAAIPDPPPVLWARGSVEFPPLAVAVVGSRAATSHALEVAHRLGEDLARAGVAVVSGLARGVDSAAHRGALSGDGRTIAVLGSGVDVVYPAEHGPLAALVQQNGAVVSELPPGTAPEGWHFPRRNRIISGLSLAVVIVEASEKSGSLITATCALEQGRTVMAVPGGVLSGRNRGAHALMKDGARVVEGVEDILQELRLDMPAPASDERVDSAAERDPIARAMIPGEVSGLERLIDLTGLGAAALLARLAELEMRGLIEREAGGWIRSRRTNVLR